MILSFHMSILLRFSSRTSVYPPNMIIIVKKYFIDLQKTEYQKLLFCRTFHMLMKTSEGEANTLGCCHCHLGGVSVRSPL